MERRKFLKLVIISSLVATPPFAALGQSSVIDGEYGEGIEISLRGNFSVEELRTEATYYLIEKARKAPPIRGLLGTRFEVLAAIPSNWGHTQRFGWYSHPRVMARIPDWKDFVLGNETSWIAERGVWRMARATI